MAADANKAVMRRFVEFINTGSEKLAEELISPDAVFHVPGRAEPMRGPAGYLAIIGMMRGGFPDIQWTLEEMIAEADKVAARFTMCGTHPWRLLRGTADRKGNCSAGHEFLSSVPRAVRRGTRSTRFAWRQRLDDRSWRSTPPSSSSVSLRTSLRLPSSLHETKLYTFPGATGGNDPRSSCCATRRQSLRDHLIPGAWRIRVWCTRWMIPGGRETVVYSFTGGTDGDRPWVGVSPMLQEI